jgi:excinuclease ABC subunit A
MPADAIHIKGARQHNLKNISLDIPRNKLVVITGLSGSGKSSLAFDTIYAEGQRRYVESLSAYARQFLGQMDKPDVDSIEGLSPAIAIEQKTHSRNPRSTVGTVTEIYDYLRLLYARVGEAHCPQCGRLVEAQSSSEIVDQLMSLPAGTKLMILAPLARGRKGEYRKAFEEARRQGFVRVRVDGQVYELSEAPALEKNKKHDIEVVVDRLSISPEIRRRLADSVETALKIGEGMLMADGAEAAAGSDKTRIFSEKLACARCNLSFEELTPRSFSFNNPHGACPDCTGLGSRMEVDPDWVVDKNKSLRQGAIEPWSGPTQLYYQEMVAQIAKHFNFSLDSPFKHLKPEHQKVLLYGTPERFPMTFIKGQGEYGYMGRFDGVVNRLARQFQETESESVREKIEGYMREVVCSTCKGARLKPEVLAVTLGGKNIIQATQLSILECEAFFENLKLGERQMRIVRQVLKEVRGRLGFLKNVGLDYLALDRTAGTLSGGEAQRIHLATQIGSSLVGVLYILDEPSIGLHQRDNSRLLETLKRLRDLGNTVLVVEHDEETMREADWLIDIGPGAGVHGGEVVAAGTPQQVAKNPKSPTGAYLSGLKSIPTPPVRRVQDGRRLELVGATLNNLKNLNVVLPLGQFVAITGVSGSGKSTLIQDTLVPALLHKVYRTRAKPAGFVDLKGAEHIDKVINIDQTAIGRTPRSNPATYTGVFDEIRALFAATAEARTRGYQPGRFSFNVKGGRCEACDGDGIKKIAVRGLQGPALQPRDFGGLLQGPHHCRGAGHDRG